MHTFNTFTGKIYERCGVPVAEFRHAESRMAAVPPPASETYAFTADEIKEQISIVALMRVRGRLNEEYAAGALSELRGALKALSDQTTCRSCGKQIFYSEMAHSWVHVGFLTTEEQHQAQPLAAQRRTCPHVPQDPDARQTACMLCGAWVACDSQSRLWMTESEAAASAVAAPSAKPDFARRLAWIEQIVPSIAPVRKEGWRPPEEPGRWLLVTRDAEGAVDTAGIYEELKTVAEIIDLTDLFPVLLQVVDLDERQLYRPERRTVAFYQPGRAVESRIEVVK